MVQVIFKSRVPVLMILCLSQGDATTVVPGTKGWRSLSMRLRRDAMRRWGLTAQRDRAKGHHAANACRTMLASIEDTRWSTRLVTGPLTVFCSGRCRHRADAGGQ